QWIWRQPRLRRRAADSYPDPFHREWFGPGWLIEDARYEIPRRDLPRLYRQRSILQFERQRIAEYQDGEQLSGVVEIAVPRVRRDVWRVIVLSGKQDRCSAGDAVPPQTGSPGGENQVGGPLLSAFGEFPIDDIEVSAYRSSDGEADVLAFGELRIRQFTAATIRQSNDLYRQTLRHWAVPKPERGCRHQRQ